MDVTFIDCVFNDCIFSEGKINHVALRTVTFNRCEIKDVNFAMCNKLTEVLFENCDLYRAEFAKSIANKANFKTSYNYTIDPKTTKLKKAVFSQEGLKGLLYKHDIIVK